MRAGTSRERGVVWVLEDSALEAEMTRRALAPENVVEVFSDDFVLLEQLAQRPIPDVLVLDWQLPGLTGLEVCRFVRSRHDTMSLPILMLTMFGRKEDIVEGLEAGANDYVTKPFDVAELAARVATLVRASRLQREERKRSRRVALLADIGAILSRAKTSDEVAAPALDAIAAYAGATGVQLSLMSDDGTLVELAAIGVALGAPDGLVEHAIETLTQAASPVGVEPGGAWVGAFPLVLHGRARGLLMLRAPSRPSGDVTSGVAQAVDYLAVGIGRVQAERDREAALEREISARSEAESANRSKDEFLAMVSHELRTPLNAIVGWSTLLLGSSLDADRQTRALETIHRNARTQAELIEDLLDISRITSGKLHVEPAPVDVFGLVEAAAESARPLAEAKQLELETDLDAGVGVVLVDPQRMQQVLSNLLSNAIKFSRPGGKVSFSLRRRADVVEIAVHDDGQGIAPDFLPYVFDRFRQADASTSRTKGGLGLGLAIVKHLVSRQGGTVVAESDGLGRGATFTVRLPLGLGQEAGKKSSASTPPVDTTSGAELEDIDVLVVDDDRDSRDLLQWLLERCGARVRAVDSAKQAIDALAVRTPEVVLSDIAMPHEDGFALLKKIRALGPEQGSELPVIALTANARAADRSEALRAGFQEHISKPVDPGALVALLKMFRRDAAPSESSAAPA